jgi:outer membrane protein OmpA-like peptidoglycan-associated protein
VSKPSERQAGGAGSALCMSVALAATVAWGAEPPGTPVSFVACPIARDTGPDTDLCFIAEHDGNRYALVNPPDWGVPQLKHRVLVEGRVTQGSFCGAAVIEGRASVLPDIDESCNVLLPFDGVIKGIAGGVFNSGSPQRQAYAKELARRAALDPSISVEPAIPDAPAFPVAHPPFEVRTLLITYPFDSDRGPGPDMVQLKELALYATAAHATRVDIAGYRATSRLIDGNELVETPSLAEARARKIAGIMRALGVADRVIRVRWESDAIAGKGDRDWQNRKVEITVTP